MRNTGMLFCSRFAGFVMKEKIGGCVICGLYAGGIWGRIKF
jgi:hypothetical protein